MLLKKKDNQSQNTKKSHSLVANSNDKIQMAHISFVKQLRVFPLNEKCVGFRSDFGFSICHMNVLLLKPDVNSFFQSRF